MSFNRSDTFPVSKHLKRKREEDDAQIKLVAWMKRNDILHYSIPNGGKRNIQQAVLMQKTGLAAGMLDLCLPIPRLPTYCGLYIEMKKPKGGHVSAAQKWWIDTLNRQGYLAVVCKGFEAAQKVVQEYLALTP